MVVVVLDVENLVLVVLVPLLDADVLLVELVYRYLLYVLEEGLEVAVLGEVELAREVVVLVLAEQPNALAANLVEDLEARRREIDVDARPRRLREALQADALLPHGVLGEELQLLGGSFANKVARIGPRIGLDQRLNDVRHLRVADAAADVVQDVLDVLQAGRLHRLYICVEAALHDQNEAGVHLYELLDDLGVSDLLLAPREAIILQDRLDAPEVLTQVEDALVRLHLLGLERVLVHAVGAQDLQLDGQALNVESEIDLVLLDASLLDDLEEVGLDLPHFLDGLDELSGGHQRLGSQDFDLQMLVQPALQLKEVAQVQERHERGGIGDLEAGMRVDADPFHDLLKDLLVVATDMEGRAGTGRASGDLLLGLLLLAEHGLQVEHNDDPEGVAYAVALLLQVLGVYALVLVGSLGVLGFLLLRLAARGGFSTGTIDLELCLGILGLLLVVRVARPEQVMPLHLAWVGGEDL